MDKMDFTFNTLGQNATSIFKDKGSKHLGFAYRVRNRSEIDELISQLRKEHNKANHVCYAYVLHTKSEPEQYNTDDGEPRNSAGPPILGQIQSRQLENTMVAVVRYFGGTKLGVSGLINAYKTTAALALDAGGITVSEDNQVLNIKVSYADYNQLISLVKKFSGSVLEEEHKDSAIIKLEVPERNLDPLRQALENLETQEIES